jgi:hypothetical protein
VRPLVDDGLDAEKRVAVEHGALHDVAGVAGEDASVRRLEKLRQPLVDEVMDVAAG